MLSSPTSSWPEGEWIMQPKWDGYRLLIDVDVSGRIRAWSRNGASLTSRLGDLLELFQQSPPGTVFDGELVALGERDGQPAQDFAQVGRAVLGNDAAAREDLRFVAFDVLKADGVDVRPRAWRDRNDLIRELLPVHSRVRSIDFCPATQSVHEAYVDLRFEGSVLKRAGSVYRAGRQSTWRKFKARHVIAGQLLGTREGRDGLIYARCALDDGDVVVLAGRDSAHRVGEMVEIRYSRIDVDGSLREARLASPLPVTT
jgi:bifunctional non-homologous end joining protein LigD